MPKLVSDMIRKATEELKKWYLDKNRKSLLIDGEKKVGKTYLVTSFASTTFSDFLYIDLEKDQDIVSLFNSSVNVGNFSSYLNTHYNKKLSSSLPLIFDNIQVCPEIISSLKCFSPSIPIILVGSNIKTSLKRYMKNNPNFLYPLDDIDTLTIYPMSFEEYLMNINPRLLEMVKTSYETRTPLENVYHLLVSNLFYQYLVTGGFPKVVQTFKDSSYVKATEVLSSIYNEKLNEETVLFSTSSTCRIRTKKVYETFSWNYLKEIKTSKLLT